MKKALIIIGIVIVVIIAILVIVPIVFKPQIVRMVKEQANKNLGANLDFSDAGLSLIRHFPNATLSVDNIIITNKAPFEGDTLAQIDKFTVTLSLGKLLGKKLEVLSLKIDQPQILLHKLADSRVNWDIVAAGQGKAEAASNDTGGGFKLALNKYEIKDGYLLYMDEASNIFAELDGINHSGKGDFTKTSFVLNTRTQIDTLNLMASGTRFLNDASLSVTANADVDMDSRKFAFKENEIRLNKLSLAFAGWVQLSGDTTKLELTFSAPKTDFKDILSVIPAVYKSNFSDIKAEGELTLDGQANGILAGEQVPEIAVRLNVDNGSISHPEMPQDMKDISIDLQVTNPGKTANDTEIDLRRFHASMGNEPVDAQLLMRTPISDPYLDGYLRGNVNLGYLDPFVAPGDTMELRGVMRADFRFRGNISAIEQKQAEKVAANGTIEFSDVRYIAPSLLFPAEVKNARINFSPQRANLSDFNLRMGDSDLRANGDLDNIFGYVFRSQTLIGTLALKSEYFNLDPWLGQRGGALQPVELPDKVNFEMNGQFGKIKLDNINMTNVMGHLQLKDRTLTLTNLSGNMLGGSMVSNGSYRYVKPEPAHINFSLDLNKLSIPDMFKTFNTVRQFAPMAGYMQGDVSGDLTMSSDLGDSLLPEWQTVLSDGSLIINQAKIENFKPINAVANTLNLARLNNPTLANFNPSYEIRDGFFHLNPAGFKIAGIDAVAAGATGLDNSIDYNLKLQIPAAELKETANKAISDIIGRDVGLLTDETVGIDVGIGGTIQDPNIKTSLSQITKGATEQLKEKALQEAEQRRQELENQAKQKVEEQKSEVQDTLQKEIEKQKEEQGEKLKDRLKGLFGK